MTQPDEPENPRPEVEGECDDFPKLTADEWAAVAALSPQPPDDDTGGAE